MANENAANNLIATQKQGNFLKVHNYKASSKGRKSGGICKQ